MEMETGGISNHYIDRLMEKISCNFRGTFSADNIPIFEEEFFSIIVNLSSEGEKGSHFIAILFSTSKILYFDSFGTQQTNSIIENYLKRYRKQIISLIIKYNIYLAHIADFFVFRLFCVRKT